MITIFRAALVGLALSLTASATQAASFTGSSVDIADFINGSEVSTNGTLIDAVNLLNDNVEGTGVSTTINGVLFKGTQPGEFHEGAELFEQASFVYHGGEGYAAANLWSSGGAYDVLADSQIFNVDNGTINAGDGFGVSNLTPGALYELQIFMLDDRSDQSKTFPLQFQQVHFIGSADNFDLVGDEDLGYIDNVTIGGNGAVQPNGEIATVTFSIDEQFNGIFVNTWNSGAFNGMQLRRLEVQANLDGNMVVDGNDFLVWQQGVGTLYDASTLEAIRDHFGEAASVASNGAVPEPSTALMGAATLGLAIAKRRRRTLKTE